MEKKAGIAPRLFSFCNPNGPDLTPSGRKGKLATRVFAFDV
jgi:hypothetical protein